MEELWRELSNIRMCDMRTKKRRKKMGKKRGMGNKVNIVGGKRTKKGVNKAFDGVTNIFNKLEKFSITKPKAK